MGLGRFFRLSLPVALLISLVNVAALALMPETAGATPPSELTFTSPPQVVTAGEAVALNWGTVLSGEFVIFGYSGPSSLNFSSSSVVQWNPSNGGAYNSTYGFWSSALSTVKIAIPSGVPAPTRFTFSLTTCTLSTGCSATDDLTLTTVDYEHPATSSMTVFAGSTVSLHWPNAPSSGDYYLFTNPSDSYPLSFSSSSVINWSGGTYNSTWHWWSSTTGGLSMAIPTGAPSGATFSFNLYTCNSGGGCTNEAGGPGAAPITITVTGSEWSQMPYSTVFSTVDTMSSSHGGFTAAAFSPDNTLWGSAEYGAAIGGSGSYPVAYDTFSSSDPTSENFSGITNGLDSSDPFAACFVTYGCPPAVSTSVSGLAESMTFADGRVWWTEGGWEFYGPGPQGQSNPPANNSEIVSVDPSNPNGSLCEYQAPAATPSLGTSDPEVVGITSTIDTTNDVPRIWFVANDPIGGHPYVGSFEPSKIDSSCSSPYILSGSTPSFDRTSIAGVGARDGKSWSAAWPTQIGADPDGSVWVDTTFPTTVDGVPNNYVYHLTTTSVLGEYPYQPTNIYGIFGAADSWDIVADSNYVYVADIGDGRIVQIQTHGPNVGQTNSVPIPDFTDKSGVFGLALQGNSLYFTVAQTFGVINVGSWESASQACSTGVNCAPAPSSATLYTGLMPVVDSGSGTYNFNGIAVSADGQVGLDQSDQHLVRLIP